MPDSNQEHSQLQAVASELEWRLDPLPPAVRDELGMSSARARMVLSQPLPQHAVHPMTSASFRNWLATLTGNGEDVARFVVNAMNDDTAPIQHRLRAATFIAERLLGKVEQHVTQEYTFNERLLRVSGLDDKALRDLQVTETPLPPEIVEVAYSVVSVESEDDESEDDESEGANVTDDFVGGHESTNLAGAEGQVEAA